MIDAVRQYLDFLQSPPEDMAARLRALAIHLDQLVVAYYNTADVEADDESIDTPPHDYSVAYKRMGALFPTLGYYADVEPIEDFDQEPTVADAIDDLADIYTDLADVVWYAENASLDEAIWHFRFGYQVHWGTHLHNVRRYLAASNVAAW